MCIHKVHSLCLSDAGEGPALPPVITNGWGTHSNTNYTIQPSLDNRSPESFLKSEPLTTILEPPLINIALIPHLVKGS